MIALIISAVLEVRAASMFTVAGGGSDDGRPADLAQLAGPVDAIFDAAGNLYIAEADNHRVRKVDAITKIITTVAGNGRSEFDGDGRHATAAAINGPRGLAFDGLGNLYIS